MKEEKRRAKPIIFSTPMVEAILDGRKTQTRRVINRDIVNQFDIDVDGSICAFIERATGDRYNPVDVAPYKVGDILWVRETFQSFKIKKPTEAIPDDFKKTQYLYRADGEVANNDGSSLKWKPSIHMPKEAARIFLEIKDVRVERLQNITEEDAMAEGVSDPYDYQHPEYYEQSHLNNLEINQAAFARLWDSLNAKRGYSFESNPFVWVYEFEVAKVFD